MTTSDADTFLEIFSEEVPEGYFTTPPRRDITESLAAIVGRAGPTGRRETIVILTNPADEQADAVAIELLRRKVPVCRLHPEELVDRGTLCLRFGDPSRPSLGRLELPSADLSLDEIKSVWVQRPQLPLGGPTPRAPRYDGGGLRRLEGEAAAMSLFAVLRHAFWVSQDPIGIKASKNRLSNLQVADAAGMIVPRTLVTNDPSEAMEFFADCHGEVVIKSLSGGAAREDGEVRVTMTSRVLRRHLDQIGLVRRVPCLFQERVPYGVEVRVTAIGRQLFATEIASERWVEGRYDWRQASIGLVPHLPHALPSDVEDTCRRFLDAYRLASGAFDFIRRPDGGYVLADFNASGPWLWVQQMTGMPLVEAMADLLIRGSILEPG